MILVPSPSRLWPPRHQKGRDEHLCNIPGTRSNTGALLLWSQQLVSSKVREARRYKSGAGFVSYCSGDSARAPRSCGIARALLSTPVTSVLIAKHGRSETTCGSRPRRPRGPAPRQRHSSHEPSPQNKKDSAETIRCPRGQSAYVMPILSHTVHPCGVILAIGSGPVTRGHAGRTPPRGSVYDGARYAIIP